MQVEITPDCVGDGAADAEETLVGVFGFEVGVVINVVGGDEMGEVGAVFDKVGEVDRRGNFPPTSPIARTSMEQRLKFKRLLTSNIARYESEES